MIFCCLLVGCSPAVYSACICNSITLLFRTTQCRYHLLRCMLLLHKLAQQDLNSHLTVLETAVLPLNYTPKSAYAPCRSIKDGMQAPFIKYERTQYRHNVYLLKENTVLFSFKCRTILPSLVTALNSIPLVGKGATSIKKSYEKNRQFLAKLGQWESNP